MSENAISIVVNHFITLTIILDHPCIQSLFPLLDYKIFPLSSTVSMDSNQSFKEAFLLDTCVASLICDGDLWTRSPATLMGRHVRGMDYGKE